MRKDPKNVAASVRQRLLNLSRKTGEEFQLLLTRYAIERLLFRLCQSEHAGRFVLKGALLFPLWTGALHRPTRDLDLLGYGENSEQVLSAVFRAVCQESAADDGLVFHPDTVRVGPIRDDQEYGGQRVLMQATLANARIDLQIDVGFGDAITPTAETVTYPSLLGMEAPRLRAYPRETVVAEKLEAIVQLGIANSRMKDFFDVLLLARKFAFAGPILRQAILATFGRRGTALPVAIPVGLSEAFADNPVKQQQWNAFRIRSGLTETHDHLRDVVSALATFLVPPMDTAAKAADFPQTWKPGGPWQMSP
jgi:predicted nucleotidyltransferase component of viral defense system